MGSNPQLNESFVGLVPEKLTVPERLALSGKWYALEVEAPNGELHSRIEAVGDSVVDCALQLHSRGLNICRYEYVLMAPPC